MSRNGFKKDALKAPEEGRGRKDVPRSNAGPFDSGFAEGEHGRGPSPYRTSHSAAPGTLAQHAATAGRGGSGRIGKGDGFKTRSEDVEHPVSHSEFEELGREDG
jgi:hypothetical protein